MQKNARDGWQGLLYQRFVRNADAPRRRGCFGVSRNQTKMPARSAFQWHFLLSRVERTAPLICTISMHIPVHTGRTYQRGCSFNLVGRHTSLAFSRPVINTVTAQKPRRSNRRSLDMATDLCPRSARARQRELSEPSWQER